MRKISIGIFSVFTAILFLISASANVVAETVEFNEVNMYTFVYSNDPYVVAQVTVHHPPIVAVSVAYIHPKATWDLDIDNGDNVEIVSTCTYYDFYSPPGEEPTGYHYYSLEATYKYESTQIDHAVDFSKYTYGAYDPPEYGEQDIGVTFYECSEGATIYVTWEAYVINLHESIEGNPVEDEDVVYGTINLI